MSKDFNFTILTLIISGAVTLTLSYNIFKQEYPNNFLIENLSIGRGHYNLIDKENNQISLETELTDSTNKTLTLKLDSLFDKNTALNTIINLTFNPLGQLFNGSISSSLNNTQSIHCELQGVKPLAIKCKNLTSDKEIIVELPSIIMIRKKPNNMYLLQGIKEENLISALNLVPYLNKYKKLKILSHDNP